MKEKNKSKEKTKTIFLTGGGTGGSVSPLLAIFQELLKKGYKIKFIWIGSKQGVERDMVDSEEFSGQKIEYKSIYAGKWRRYFSLFNFLDLFKVVIAFFQSLFLVLKHKPDLVMSAGSFVSVPVVWASGILRKPVLIHQQDVRPGLANRLMSPFARVVTTTFKESLSTYGSKARVIGNIIRMDLDSEKGNNYFKVKEDPPIMLVIGGGTGAKFINNLIENNLEEITRFVQVIHITGEGKAKIKAKEHYISFEFLEHDRMLQALRKANFVVSRCGLGFLTEISYLGKPAILIPIPDSHQEDNAMVFSEKDAALVRKQKSLNKEVFLKDIKNLAQDKDLRDRLSSRVQEVIKIGNKEAVEIIEKILKLK